MKRWALRICVFLLLGAIVNIAVAWGAAIPANNFGLSADYVRYQYEDGSLLDGMVQRRVGTLYVAIVYLSGAYTPRPDRDDITAFIERQSPHVRRGIMHWIGRVDAPRPPSSYIAVIARGWPMRALYSIEEVDSGRRQTGTRAEFTDHGAIIIPAMARGNTGFAPFYAIALPYWPIWPGFAINTLFYAGILWGGWLLFAAPFALRRRRRIKRGLCPKCAYPIGKSNVCTECGKPVTSAQTSRAGS